MVAERLGADVSIPCPERFLLAVVRAHCADDSDGVIRAAHAYADWLDTQGHRVAAANVRSAAGKPEKATHER